MTPPKPPQELLSCPFCGGESHYSYQITRKGKSETIVCLNCYNLFSGSNDKYNTRIPPQSADDGAAAAVNSPVPVGDEGNREVPYVAAPQSIGDAELDAAIKWADDCVCFLTSRFETKALSALSKAAKAQSIWVKGDYIKLPVPPGEHLEALLAHPETKFKWNGDILVITNPHFPARIAQFEEIMRSEAPSPSKEAQSAQSAAQLADAIREECFYKSKRDDQDRFDRNKCFSLISKYTAALKLQWEGERK